MSIERETIVEPAASETVIVDRGHRPFGVIGAIIAAVAAERRRVQRWRLGQRRPAGNHCHGIARQSQAFLSIILLFCSSDRPVVVRQRRAL